MGVTGNDSDSNEKGGASVAARALRFAERSEPAHHTHTRTHARIHAHMHAHTHKYTQPRAALLYLELRPVSR